MPHEEYQVIIRAAKESDLSEIAEIYAYYVENTVISFDEEARSLPEWREKLVHLAELGLPFLVAASPDGQILGFAYVSPWNPRAAYRYTVEDTIYLRPSATGLHLGPRLMNALLDECRERSVRVVVSLIADEEADRSIRMHERLGFEAAGTLPDVGYKFGRSVGIVILRKALAGNHPAASPILR